MRTHWLIPLLVLLGALPASAERWAQRDFLISFWSPPPATDENLARVKEEGFNLTWVPEEGLAVAQRHGLRAMLQSNLLNPATLDDHAKRAELDALIDRVKSHPALEAYYITDEPGAGAFSGLARIVAYLRERDPAHFAYINLYPTYASAEQLGVSADAAERARVGSPTDSGSDDANAGVVRRYHSHLHDFIDMVKPDLLSYDHYHFLHDKDGNDQDGKEYFLNLGMMRAAAIGAGRPFLNIIQADTIIKSWRLPDAAEMRWLVYTTMAYGGRGISYFTYWGPPEYNGLYTDGKKMPLMEPVSQLNREMQKLGPALLGLESLGAYHIGGALPYGARALPAGAPVQVRDKGEYVLGIFGTERGPNAFMVVNRDYRYESNAKVTVNMRGRHLQELDRATGEWVRVKTLRGFNEVCVTLAPGDGRLFRVAE